MISKCSGVGLLDREIELLAGKRVRFLVPPNSSLAYFVRTSSSYISLSNFSPQRHIVTTSKAAVPCHGFERVIHGGGSFRKCK